MNRLLRGLSVTLLGVPLIYLGGFLADRPWPSEVAAIGLVVLGLLLAVAPPVVGWLAARGAGRAGLVGAVSGWLLANLVVAAAVGSLTVPGLTVLLAGTILCPIGAGAAMLRDRRARDARVERQLTGNAVGR